MFDRLAIAGRQKGQIFGRDETGEIRFRNIRRFAEGEGQLRVRLLLQKVRQGWGAGPDEIAHPVRTDFSHHALGNVEILPFHLPG